jgi:hypothetical protein
MNNNESMNKLLILLLLIPMVSFGEKGYTPEELGLTQKDLDNAKIVQDEKEIKQRKSWCAQLSGKAKNEYSAKKIYKNCLDEQGLKD